MTNSIAEIEKNDALFVIGSNTTENHPIVALAMKKAVFNGAKLIVADPRKIPLVKFATLWLRQRPGTDTALINSIMHVILKEGLEDKAFIGGRTEGFDDFKKSLKKFTPAYGEKTTGVPAKDIVKAARIYAEADRAGVYYAMGITQHSMGTNNVHALGNLVMLTGNIGKESCGVNPLRGQNNVQGACDMGCSPNVLPGYQSVTDLTVRQKFEESWGMTIPDKVGLTATEMTEAMYKGDLKALYVMGENPALSDPNINHSVEAFKKLDLLIVQDIFMSETAELADVVLPAASFAEKEGTFTNTERRVQRVRKAVPPPGQAKDDLTIINEIASRMGGHKHIIDAVADLGFKVKSEQNNDGGQITPEDAFLEAQLLWPAMRGMTYQRLKNGGLQWPCPTRSHPGTPYLFKESFTRGSEGKALFTAIPDVKSKELPDKEYPFVLTTGRILFHYHTGTMTRRSKGLEAVAPEPFIELNPADAKKNGFSDAEMVKVSSRRGNISLKVKVTERVPPKVVFIPFHYKEAAANILTNDALDPICKIPEAKVCAVKIEKTRKKAKAN
jgi:formate dehydrogenase alpha subunit